MSGADFRSRITVLDTYFQYPVSFREKSPGKKSVFHIPKFWYVLGMAFSMLDIIANPAALV